MNESEKNTIELIVMLYELSEKGFFANEKSIEKSFVEENFENSHFNEKSIEESLKKNFIAQTDFVTRIKAVYSDDVIFQKIIQSKRENRRRILKNITKSKMRLELDDCNIVNEMLYIKNKLYVFNDE